jgi:hypothetical protein
VPLPSHTRYNISLLHLLQKTVGDKATAVLHATQWRQKKVSAQKKNKTTTTRGYSPYNATSGNYEKCSMKLRLCLSEHTKELWNILKLVAQFSGITDTVGIRNGKWSNTKHVKQQ